MRFLLGALTVIFVGGLLALGVIYSGVCSVAATQEDPAMVKWVLETAMEAHSASSSNRLGSASAPLSRGKDISRIVSEISSLG